MRLQQVSGEREKELQSRLERKKGPGHTGPAGGPHDPTGKGKPQKCLRPGNMAPFDAIRQTLTLE